MDVLQLRFTHDTVYRFDTHYTHSSFWGAHDFATGTGRLAFPGEDEAQQALHTYIARSYEMGKPLCWVDMCTTHHPLIEDIDIFGGSSDAEAWPERILVRSRSDLRFWSYRAEVLQQPFPDAKSLELGLYSAHGSQRSEQCLKRNTACLVGSCGRHEVWKSRLLARNYVRVHSFRPDCRIHGPHKGESVRDLVRKLGSGEVSSDSLTPLVAVTFLSKPWWGQGEARWAEWWLQSMPRGGQRRQLQHRDQLPAR